MILGILLFAVVETLTMAWVLTGKTAAASIALAVVVFAEWVWEITHLAVTAQRIQEIEPRVKATRVMLIYAACWAAQVIGCVLFYVAMKVHTLPLAFELVAAHVMVSTVFYLVRNCIQGVLVRADLPTIAGQPWWEAGASCAGISPLCGLLAILACKTMRLF